MSGRADGVPEDEAALDDVAIRLHCDLWDGVSALESLDAGVQLVGDVRQRDWCLTSPRLADALQQVGDDVPVDLRDSASRRPSLKRATTAA